MTALTWMYVLVHLRMISIAVLVGAFAWALMAAPPSFDRTLRLILAIILISFNVASILISILIFKVPPL